MRYEAQEEARLAALDSYGVLATPPQEEFDTLATAAAALCGTPMAVIGFHGEDQVWHKAMIGLDARKIPRSDNSFCTAAMRQGDVLVVEDALHDRRFKDFELVSGPPHVRFYAGAPIMAPGGLPLGTICAIDTVPRSMTPNQVDALRAMAKHVMALLEGRLQRGEAIPAFTPADDGLRRELVNATAHAVMNPLTPLLLQVRILRSEATPAQLAGLDAMERSIRRLQGSVAAVLKSTEPVTR